MLRTLALTAAAAVALTGCGAGVEVTLPAPTVTKDVTASPLPTDDIDDADIDVGSYAETAAVVEELIEASEVCAAAIDPSGMELLSDADFLARVESSYFDCAQVWSTVSTGDVALDAAIDDFVEQAGNVAFLASEMSPELMDGEAGTVLIMAVAGTNEASSNLGAEVERWAIEVGGVMF